MVVRVSSFASYWEPEQTSRSAHCVFLVSVAAAVWYLEAVSHWVTFLHSRLEVGVSFTLSYWSPLHVFSVAHSRLEVGVFASVSYSVVTSHSVKSAQIRLEVSVFASVSYSVLSQVLTSMHERSSERDGAAAWYWSGVHDCQSWQVRSLVDVPTVLIHCSASQSCKSWHTLSILLLTPSPSNSP